MSSGNRVPTHALRDSDLAGAEVAMRRAAKRARRRAETAAQGAGAPDRRTDISGGAHEVVVDALQTLRGSGLDGAVSHLRSASECINARDWAGSVRESIHADESVARQLDPEASRTLGPALKALEKHGSLHPALEDAFSKLYGYASDEQGIRHALLERADHNVGMDEAVFMLSACASFASYLWRKHTAQHSP